MTDKEKKEFFEQVAGKRIRWTGWSESEYFIPKRLNIKDMTEYELTGIDQDGKTLEWEISNGFDSNFDGLKWEFYEDKVEEEELKKIIVHIDKGFMNLCHKDNIEISYKDKRGTTKAFVSEIEIKDNEIYLYHNDEILKGDEVLDKENYFYKFNLQEILEENWNFNKFIEYLKKEKNIEIIDFKILQKRMTGTKDKLQTNIKTMSDEEKENFIKIHRAKIQQKKEAVNHPDHYNTGKYEVIDVIEDWKLNFNLGNVIKYVSRADHKGNKIEDLKKALWYLKREIERGEIK